MSGTISITAGARGGVVIRPESYLGRALFDVYLSAIREVDGAVYDGSIRANRLPDHNQIPAAIEALEAAGFAVALDPKIVAATEAVAEDAAQERKRILGEMARAEERISGSGLAPFPYQRDGILWLACRRAGILGDEMGLGKTVQALLSIPEGARAVVVCPSSLKGNWAAECLRWRPDLTPRILSGHGSFRWPAGPRELVIINDDVLPPPGECEIPPADPVVIYDEAHRGKGGKKTKRGAAFLALRDATFHAGGRVLLLTGTPLVNRPKELKAVLDLGGLFNEAFGSYQKFRRAFPDGGAPRPEAAEGLRRVMLARRREDVLPDLPSKTWEDLPVPLDRETARELDTAARAIEAAGFSVEKLDRSALREPIVFEQISRIRAACAAAKIPAMIEHVARCEAEDQPLVVFSAHRAPIDVLASRKGWAVITGSTPAADRTEIVRRFQAGALRGIAGTIAAMGVGVTLTYARQALFVDLDWTPAGNSQAEDRICRIGQKNAVQITTLIGDHPIDRRVSEILAEKKVQIDGSVTAAARGEQQTAASLLADLEERERLAREKAEAHRRNAAAYIEAEKKKEAARATAQKIRAALTGAPSGGYAIRGADGRVTFWQVDTVTRGSWSGWIFLAQQVGGSRIKAGGVRPSDEIVGRDAFSAASAEATLLAIAEDPREASALYGRELGICGVCGSELTNEESREYGIGPVCRDKF